MRAKLADQSDEPRQHVEAEAALQLSHTPGLQKSALSYALSALEFDGFAPSPKILQAKRHVETLQELSSASRPVVRVR